MANREHNEDEDPFFISDNEDEHVKNGEVDEDLARFVSLQFHRRAVGLFC